LRSERTSALATSAPTLLQRVAQGDEGAVRDCIDRFGGLVWSLARRMVPREAEDAVQEIFVEIWKHAYRYDPAVASETAFVAMIARRRLIDRRRRIERRPDEVMLSEDSPETDKGLPPASEVSEDAQRAVAALNQLSTEQQRVLRLSIYRGLSHERIATVTGLPLGTVKTHARRGLMRIRDLLKSESAGEDSGFSGLGLSKQSRSNKESD
jgi:RNA polymerase sigma factor (sigma-70 family)